MAKFHDIPSMNTFMAALEKIREEQMKARETSKVNVYPFEAGTNNEYSHFGTGIITPKDKHYLIGENGELSFTGTHISSVNQKEEFPPFSCAEMLLESKDDFKIDYGKAAEYYNLNKELAVRENENILMSNEYKPQHPIIVTMKQEMNDVIKMLDSKELDTKTQSDVSVLMDQHLLKIESLIKDFSELIDRAAANEVPQLEESLKEKLTKLFTDFKDNIKQILIDTKDQVRTGIEDKVNEFKNGISDKVTDVKVNIHNSIASRVQTFNDKVKDFSQQLDNKYQVIDTKEEAPKAIEKLDKAEAEKLLTQYMDSHIKSLDARLVMGEGTRLNFSDKEVTMAFPVSLNNMGARKENHLVSIDLDSAKGTHQREYHKGNNDFKSVEYVRSLQANLVNKPVIEMASEGPSDPLKQAGQPVVSVTLEKPANGHESAVKAVSEVPKQEPAEINQLKKENEQLQKEAAGLKTFVKLLKKSNPEVFETLINTMKDVQNQDQKSIRVPDKPKEKVALEI